MVDFAWDAVQTDTVATTALNSLAAGTYSGVLTEVDNTVGTGNYQYGVFHLELGADLTALTGAPFVGVYIVYALDGTNYPNPPSGTGAVPDTYKVQPILANSAATFRRGYSVVPVPLLPFKFKPIIYHGLHGSTAFNSSGNILTLYRLRDASL